MAYSEKDLTSEWIPQVKVPNGDNVNLMAIREAIQKGADEICIPVAFREEQVKVGSLLNRQLEDILVMYNPKHARDYRKFVIRMEHRGKWAFVSVYNMGGSKNYMNSQVMESRSLMRKAFGVDRKLLEENQYYEMLADVLVNGIGDLI